MKKTKLDIILFFQEKNNDKVFNHSAFIINHMHIFTVTLVFPLIKYVPGLGIFAAPIYKISIFF